MERNKISKILKLLIGLVIILGIIFWFYSHALIEVNVANPGEGSFTYELLNQSGQNSTNVKTPASKITRIVPKGNYEVLVTQGNKSYFSVVKTNGFLAKSHISVSLSAEKQRSYVGYKPAQCMYYDGVLYSYACGGPYASINKHVPASLVTPTYVYKNVPTGIDGQLEGMVKTSEGTVALVHPIDAEGPAPHIAYLLDSSLKPLKQSLLVGLDSSTTYSITNYRTGFLVYSSGLNKLAYYSSLNANPEDIIIKQPEDKSLKPILLNADGNYITITYSSSSGNAIDTKSAKEKNTVMLYSNTDVKALDFNGLSISSVAVCGEGKICVLSHRVMSVYAPSAQKNELLYSVHGVNSMATLGSSLVLVRDNQVLSLNPDHRDGSVDYSYGDYRFCGMQKIDPIKYVLCLSGSDDRIALLINRSVDNNDSIDKKIQQLQKSSAVSNLSIYGSYIYISPNLGALVYDDTLKGYTYNPAVKKAVGMKLNQEIDKLSIDRSTYTIINTSD